MSVRPIDVANSQVQVRTRSRGLLAKLAHDLELVAHDFQGQVTLEEGTSWSCELSFAVQGLRVAGVRRNQRLDATVLSAADRDEIERKIRQEVLPIERVRVRAGGKKRDVGEVTVIGPGGEQSNTCSFRIRADGDQFIVKGQTELSLRQLGISEIRGPLGAFKVHDCIAVQFSFRC